MGKKSGRRVGETLMVGVCGKMALNALDASKPCAKALLSRAIVLPTSAMSASNGIAAPVNVSESVEGHYSLFRRASNSRCGTR